MALSGGVNTGTKTFKADRSACDLWARSGKDCSELAIYLVGLWLVCSERGKNLCYRQETGASRDGIGVEKGDIFAEKRVFFIKTWVFLAKKVGIFAKTKDIHALGRQ